MLNNNIIVIRGHAGSYKSDLAQILTNSINDRKCCYIDLDINKKLKLNENITLYQDNIKDFSVVEEIINQNDVVVIDYLSLFNLFINENALLHKLCVLVKKRKKTLITVECISCNRDLLSDEKYQVLKSNADLIITLDTNLITM
ncbi:MAG: hypothetical protein E7164_01145 [Firmicutes bacterium]|nr:hypothetical protein [Bacillota bacterium]